MQYWNLKVKVRQPYVLAETLEDAQRIFYRHINHFLQIQIKSEYGTKCDGTLFESQEDFGNPSFE